MAVALCTSAFGPDQSRPPLRLHRPDLNARELDLLAAARDFSTWPRCLSLPLLARATAIDFGDARAALAALGAKGLLAGADLAAYARGPLVVTAEGLLRLPPGPPKILGTMLAAGWLPGAPGHRRHRVGLPRAVRIDREMCWTMLCGECRRTGLSYRPMRRKGECVRPGLDPRAVGLYRAYGVCLRCGWAEEV
jgi:hypothetical protein